VLYIGDVGDVWCFASTIVSSTQETVREDDTTYMYTFDPDACPGTPRCALSTYVRVYLSDNT
jgi:hypothetical protein